MSDIQIVFLFVQAVILVVQVYLFKAETKRLDKKNEELIRTYIENSIEGDKDENGVYTRI